MPKTALRMLMLVCVIASSWACGILADDLPPDQFGTFQIERIEMPLLRPRAEMVVGAGPAGTVFVLGGSSPLMPVEPNPTTAEVAARIKQLDGAFWDGESWLPLPDLPAPRFRTRAIHRNRQLLVGGPSYMRPGPIFGELEEGLPTAPAGVFVLRDGDDEWTSIPVPGETLGPLLEVDDRLFVMSWTEDAVLLSELVAGESQERFRLPVRRSASVQVAAGVDSIWVFQPDGPTLGKVDVANFAYEQLPLADEVSELFAAGRVGNAYLLPMAPSPHLAVYESGSDPELGDTVRVLRIIDGELHLGDGGWGGLFDRVTLTPTHDGGVLMTGTFINGLQTVSADGSYEEYPDIPDRESVTFFGGASGDDETWMFGWRRIGNDGPYLPSGYRFTSDSTE